VQASPLIRDKIARLFAAHFLSGGVPVVLFDRLPDTARADLRAFHRVKPLRSRPPSDTCCGSRAIRSPTIVTHSGDGTS